MPTVLREQGLRFFFFSNERQEAPHVHVEAGEDHAKFWLDPVALAQSSGFKAPVLRQARLLVMQHRDEFRKRWHEHFRT